MNSHFQAENYLLRQQLEQLLHEARLNEEKMRRFDRLERQLIGASSFSEVVALLLSEYKQASGIEVVTLMLVDHDGESSQALQGEHGADSGLLLSPTATLLVSVFNGNFRPWLGPYSGRFGSLFQAPSELISSVAILPLVRKGQVIGSLNLGSSDSDRYTSNCGTDFLERLSEIISVCLESTLNQERLKRVGLTDALTGVQNRRYFEHRCQVEISQARRYKHPLACMFLDIDKFKRINDSYGHQTGDIVLRSVAAQIQSLLRAGDTVARYGGEEFVVLLPQALSHDALDIAERIRASVAKAYFHSTSGHEISVTISIGLSMLTLDGAADVNVAADQLVATADKALYQAKNTGRNRVVFEVDRRAESKSKFSWLLLLSAVFLKASKLLNDNFRRVVATSI